MTHDPSSGFEIVATSDGARAGLLTTAHGVLETPAFVAVATQGSVKGVSPDVVREAGSRVLFANTYHLYLRPGADLVARHGGLHRFMGWDGPILTDSGGFQVFSLGAGIEHGVGKVATIFPGESSVAPVGRPGAGMVKVEEDRVLFTSHVDGSRHAFTPEVSIRIQRALGADVILAFDECTSPLHDEAYTAASSERTHRWADRSLRTFLDEPAVHDYPQRLYGIVQGGAFPALRKRSADVIGSMGFGGVAIGGNLGDTRASMLGVLDATVPRLPTHLPRHLLGMGDVPSIFAGVARGIDTFDCVAPTRNARNGGLLARFDDDGRPLPSFRRNLRNARYADDLRPIDATCDCTTCKRHSRAFVRHLLKAGEPLGAQLATVHNLRFMSRLMEEIREATIEGRFPQVMASWMEPALEEARRGGGGRADAQGAEASLRTA